MSALNRHHVLFGLGKRADEIVQVAGHVEDVAERKADETGVYRARCRVDVLKYRDEADERDHEHRERL